MINERANILFQMGAERKNYKIKMMYVCEQICADRQCVMLHIVQYILGAWFPRIWSRSSIYMVYALSAGVTINGLLTRACAMPARLMAKCV